MPPGLGIAGLTVRSAVDGGATGIPGERAAICGVTRIWRSLGDPFGTVRAAVCRPGQIGPDDPGLRTGRRSMARAGGAFLAAQIDFGIALAACGVGEDMGGARVSGGSPGSTPPSEVTLSFGWKRLMDARHVTRVP